jgi:hypothetical protein
VHERHDVELEHLALALPGDGEELAEDTEARVVDEDVHLHPGGAQALVEGLPGRGVGEVDGLDPDLDSVGGAQLLRQGAQPVFPPRGEHEAAAPARKLAGEVRPEPARGAGHECAPAVQVAHAGVPPGIGTSVPRGSRGR